MANVWRKTNVWGQTENEVDEPILSFVEIMSEELVEQLAKEDGGNPGTSFTEYKDDEEMARALQREFDRELEISALLENTPGKSKTVSVATDRYCPNSRQWGNLTEGKTDCEEEDEEELRKMYTSQNYEKMNEVLGPFIGGLARGPNGDVISKHDPSIVNSRNVEHAMNGMIDVPTGDCYSVGLHSNAKVFNKLRNFCKTEQKRTNRLKDKEEKATMETSVDAVSRLTLFKWINQGLFDRIEGIIATGKESAVLCARSNAYDSVGSSCFFAVKVYKNSLVEFKNRSEYVQNDFRFKNPRRVMRVWAEKEFMNLTRMYNKQLPCPQPIKLKKHIMVMSFIGDCDGIAAPKLKNVVFEDEVEKERAFLQVKEIVCRMYKECNLVHGDLSEFNLLWKDGRVSVIDVSQAMDLSHPRVLHYLLRDLSNVLSYFGRQHTQNLPTQTALFNEVTDLLMNEFDDLSCQVEAFEAVNRNTQLRIDKSQPADMELRKHYADLKAGERDPAEGYI